MRRIAALLVFTMAAAACSAGRAGPPPAALQAIEASLTAAAAFPILPSGTPAPAPQSVPTPSPAPAATAPPLAPDVCAYDLRFLDDLTVPDGTAFQPGEAFDKRWQVQNTGDCAWGAAFRVVLVEGDPLGSPPEIALFPALPEAEGVVRALMVAPQAPGAYSGTWSARDPQGNLFGARFWVRITVAGE